MSKDIIIVIAILAFTVILTSVDVVADLAEGTSLAHVAIEACVVVLASGSAVLLLRVVLNDYRNTITSQSVDLEKSRAQLDHYRQEAQTFLKGLAVQIDKQFSSWNLSGAEKEIGFLLIKGFSIKEIADTRQVKEKTIRQQCLSIYRKSGLAGRAELAAFFLEDLLLPSEWSQASHGQAGSSMKP